MALIDDAKSYYDHTDDGVTQFVAAAELYLANAGIAKDETNELYCLAVKMLATHWSDKREVVGKADKLALGIDSIISQLKYTPTVVV